MATLKPVSEMKYHPMTEEIVDYLCAKAQNDERLFFRVLMAYYYAQMASSMRARIVGYDRNPLPINIYALNLSPSGTGKGLSVGFIEKNLIKGFEQQFLEYTFPAEAALSLEKLAKKRAARKNTEEADELARCYKEFEGYGSLLYSFSEGTSPAVKQVRQKLLLANAGSLNLQVDEIGANLLGVVEVLNTFVEMYDTGDVKDKLTKASSENLRHEKVPGSTPANMLLFGTPTKLFDGGETEKQLYDMLEMGFGRRCLFGFVTGSQKRTGLTAEEIYDQMFDTSSASQLDAYANQFTALAHTANMRKDIRISKEVALHVLQYRIECQAKGALLSEHDSIKKGEIDNRFFKALKLAGAYAFVDGSPEITMGHLEMSIKLVEESGEAFLRLMSPERPYVKLAKYFGNLTAPVTMADMDSDLPYFRGSKQNREDMIQMAIAWGYKNNIIIKKTYQENILFMTGETLKKTDLNEMLVCFTQNPDMTTGYRGMRQPFDKLWQLTQAPGYHWLNHEVVDGYRNEENAIPGCNLLVLDVDGTCQLSTAKMLLEGHKAMFYTTKRHTDATNRFRILLPLSHEVKMDAKEYKEFVNNILQSLPFAVDEECSHRCKKWLSNPGHYEYIDGELFDVLPFIPRTSKDEERKRNLSENGSLDRLERWVLENTGDGNRNKMFLRYAMILVDARFSSLDIREKLLALNDKIDPKMEESEIDNSIMVTVRKKAVS